ncbi:MAG: CpXC domain-containing protein [Terriglobales bacterium]
MSMQDRVGAICPHCGKMTQNKIWGTVNVGINPELREEVLTGRVRRTTCPFCSSEFNVEWHFLYHDPKGKFMISYHPTKDGRSAPIPTVGLDLVEGVLSNYKLRLVTSWNELREKIGIFESGLDDYPIETIKLLLGLGGDEVFYLCTRQNSDGVGELVFQVFRGREYLMDAWFPSDGYVRLAQEAEKKFGVGCNLGQWMIVNRATLEKWILKA